MTKKKEKVSKNWLTEMVNICEAWGKKNNATFGEKTAYAEGFLAGVIWRKK